MLAFPRASPLKPTVRTCRCHPQRGRCRAQSLSPLLSQITVEDTLEDSAAKATHFSPLIMMSGRRRLRAKIQINKTLCTCSFYIYIPLNESMCTVYSGTCLSLGVIKPHTSKIKCADRTISSAMISSSHCGGLCFETPSTAPFIQQPHNVRLIRAARKRECGCQGEGRQKPII